MRNSGQADKEKAAEQAVKEKEDWGVGGGWGGYEMKGDTTQPNKDMRSES